MEKNYKLQIYQNIIQYLLESHPFTLKNIADLSNASVETIQCIYSENNLPKNFSGISLILLFKMTIEHIDNINDSETTKFKSVKCRKSPPVHINEAVSSIQSSY